MSAAAIVVALVLECAKHEVPTWLQNESSDRERQYSTRNGHLVSCPMCARVRELQRHPRKWQMLPTETHIVTDYCYQQPWLLDFWTFEEYDVEERNWSRSVGQNVMNTAMRCSRSAIHNQARVKRWVFTVEIRIPYQVLGVPTTSTRVIPWLVF